ncbi:hypothetical protein CBE01nite_29770 [Clostridium beijerinckii]|uniref:Phage protein n=1 Tax=Clostridium beijerinckii TaxID=1520 RepID=A0AB74VD23_CLOBE|nr:hypothetical protein [Clostridium beijerinckii]NRZ28757.1 hypothetical protein [Clostridium beijerinckii]NYB95467.1 hypothetical protein [Clostridium beijerinckii]OOM24582.1 hypothetical protein CLBEI_20430 [Clostridium beijerinckii]QUN34435.1 hypothetical protein KEC93_21300 [Clostridium beijerinckii]SQB00611.1 Uncharacterised protein [Clostridium beijerinckii]
MIDLILILGLGIIALFLSARIDILQQENKGLRDTIKRDREWFEVDKRTSVELAKVNERFKISREEYVRKCEEFERQCKEYTKGIK